jgi:hypothetical protein
MGLVGTADMIDSEACFGIFLNFKSFRPIFLCTGTIGAEMIGEGVIGEGVIGEGVIGEGIIGVGILGAGMIGDGRASLLLVESPMSTVDKLGSIFTRGLL